MMEKLGQAKTHLELKKMIAEVDTRDAGKVFLVLFVLVFHGDITMYFRNSSSSGSSI